RKRRHPHRSRVRVGRRPRSLADSFGRAGRLSAGRRKGRGVMSAARTFLRRTIRARALAGLVGLGCAAGASVAAPPSPPLVMENADKLEGVRSTGEYVLSGNVRFRHGDLRLETQRALWQRERNRVISETAMRITNRGALLTADRGSYDRNADRAEAVGRV